VLSLCAQAQIIAFSSADSRTRSIMVEIMRLS
jgi:hypothetical protein